MQFNTADISLPSSAIDCLQEMGNRLHWPVRPIQPIIPFPVFILRPNRVLWGQRHPVTCAFIPTLVLTASNGKDCPGIKGSEEGSKPRSPFWLNRKRILPNDKGLPKGNRVCRGSKGRDCRSRIISSLTKIPCSLTEAWEISADPILG